MSTHSPEAAALTALILEAFRLNGRLLADGDRLTGDLGLSSARWQVMGAIEAVPLPVAQIARDMGLTRQAVQRLANALADEGLVTFELNPNHRRAKLVHLTDRGRLALNEVNRRQVEWSNRLAAGLAIETIEAALALMHTLRQRLETDQTEEA